MNRIAFYCVFAKVLINENDNYFPVKNGDKVYLCDEGEDLYKIIYSGYSKQNYIPVAIQTMYNGSSKPLKLCALLDKRYLIGPDAAHLNISGMSGVASKTTKAMAILRELYYCDKDITIVIFNTKGNDLLQLNNSKDKLDPIYGKLALFRGGEKSKVPFPSITLRPIDDYVLDYGTQKEKGNLDLLVVDDADTSGTMDSCTKAVQNDELEATGWNGLKTEVETISDDIAGIRAISWRKYSRVINRVFNDNNENSFSELFADNNVDKDLSALLDKMLEPHKVLVIDLAALDKNPLQQAYVFGCTMRAIREYCGDNKENEKKHKVAVFVDELNKYASEDTSASSPILKDLIDVAERGRSLGLCLVTAEQSLSIIHRRIKANIANYIYGRTGTLELTQYDYAMIPQVFKQQMTMFQHADGLIYTPTLNTGLLKAKFPDKFYEEK